jgi:CRISPR-associated endonuclease/helicase Cas3
MEPMPLAHSARPKRGISAQPYAKHIFNVTKGSVERATTAAKFTETFGGLLRAAVRLAGEFHDLGKLDSVNQQILRTISNRKLDIRHEDAGVAHLLNQGSMNFIRNLAALVIYSHHKGLPSIIHESNRKEHCFRDCDSLENCDAGFGCKPLRQLTDERLEAYLKTHNAFVGGLPEVDVRNPSQSAPPLLCRISLSCLVDADHTDTACHYKESFEKEVPELRAEKRLSALDLYVAMLSKRKTDDRTLLRHAIYHECRDRDPALANIWECDSPVGTGKTTAVMAHLLRAAQTKKLRRLFVVLPFTNIIDQTVSVYRRSLVLAGEDPELVVAAHHHKAEYETLEGRHLSALWRSPIVVTTAVQFFETLAGASTGSLRKLHELVGAGVFIDESHACLPAKLWPQAWKWIRRLAAEWGCHFVLGSGSLNRVWMIPGIVKEPQIQELPPLVQSNARLKAADAEQRRVQIRRIDDRLSLPQFVNWLDDSRIERPCIVIVNTVQIAAALAEMLADGKPHGSVLHLSTALTPHHRAIVLDLVKARLAYGSENNWILVATSCVESGVELSFRNGMRQSASLASLLQLCGRVSRHSEYPGAEVWDFSLVPGGLVNQNPGLEDSAIILAELFTQNRIGPEHCTEALRREVILSRKADLNKELEKAESNRDFPTVQKLFRIIEEKTVTAVVSKALQEKLERREPVDWRELQKHSVQIYTSKIEQLGLEEAPGIPGLFFWRLPYNDFLGYMAGALPLVKGGVDGGFIF